SSRRARVSRPLAMSAAVCMSAPGSDGGAEGIGRQFGAGSLRRSRDRASLGGASAVFHSRRLEGPPPPPQRALSDRPAAGPFYLGSLSPRRRASLSADSIARKAVDSCDAPVLLSPPGSVWEPAPCGALI